jgi:hypothetical protein
MNDPRREALDRVGGAFEVRVIEPSPPAIAAPPWFADDPVARGDVPGGRRVLSPIPTGDTLWEDLATADADLAAWCAERWLGAYRRLEELPAGYAATRGTLHTIAETVVSPARERSNGKIGLRYTRDGFGTPFFGDRRQVRVEGAELVRTGPDDERREALDVGAQAVHALADVFGFATNVLEVLRAELPGAGRVQLWPEHFDVGLDVRSASGEELVAGVSPGDEHYAEPYVYVVGAQLVVLEYPALLAAPDQRAAALEFLRANVWSSTPP